MQCHYIYIFKKWKNLTWKYYQMVKYIPFLKFCYKFYLIIQKIKVKFLMGENKYVCEYCKIIWIPNPKCNTHMEGHFKISGLGTQTMFFYTPKLILWQLIIMNII
jgi:hypothetical protein